MGDKLLSPHISPPYTENYGEPNVTRKRLGSTGLETSAVILGGNVFGWTIDAATSFDILDRFLDSGLNTIDTADAYGARKPVRTVGDSEQIIGNWLRRRGKRDDVVIITKVGSDIPNNKKDLSAPYIERAVEASLSRLGVDAIDLLLSHWPDPETPYEETLGAFDKLVRSGKVRAIGTSNLNAKQLRDSFDAATAHSLPRYDVLQPEYNLYDRAGFENDLRDFTISEDIGVITYFSLAKGFLSGKYRSAADLEKSERGERVKAYLNERGFRILSALDAVAARNAAKPAEIALAWLISRPGVTAPISSATSPSQLESIARAATLTLSEEDKKELDGASRV